MLTAIRTLLRVALLALLVPIATPVRAETPSAPSGAEIRELEQRLDALKKQVDQLEAAKDNASRQSLMRQNWRAMQDYMGFLHSRWGAAAPWMMDPDARGGPGFSGCPMLGGVGAAWPLPEGVSPQQYVEQMRAHMQTMNEQMDEIAKATDPKERERLLQEHWLTTYRDLQGMRGMGWMWWGGGTMDSIRMHGAPPRGAEEAKPLPAPDSAGAKLVGNFCVQCHAAPAPTLLTGAEWESAINRMHLRSQGRGTVVKVPSEEELQTILSYMKQHAR